MSQTWTSLKQCAEGGARSAGGGPLGGIYGCLASVEDPGGAVRALGRDLKSAWEGAGDALEDLLGLDDDDKPRAPMSLEGALLRTAGHLEHRRTFRHEACRYRDRKTTAADYLENDCGMWSPSDPERPWHANNRRALYGPAGAATDAVLLYKGLAVQYAKLRNLGAKGPPQEVLARAIGAYGDFLAARYPEGQTDESRGSVEAWEPTAALRARRQALESRRKEFNAVETTRRRGALPWLLGAGAALLVGGGLTYGLTQ